VYILSQDQTETSLTTADDEVDEATFASERAGGGIARASALAVSMEDGGDAPSI
jgi:hypothetical protein